MELQDWLLVFGTSIASIVATLLVIPASRMATPTIVNMVRSTELLFAYVVEFALYGTVPQPLVAAGAALVLASITSMTLADKIQGRLDKLFHRSSLEKDEDLDRDLGSTLLESPTYTELKQSTDPRLHDSDSDSGCETEQHTVMSFVEVCPTYGDVPKDRSQGA